MFETLTITLRSLWKYRVESLGAMFAFWTTMGVMVNTMLDYFRSDVRTKEKAF
jgi:hypothetical protein